MVYGSDILILLAYYTGALILVLLLSAQLEHPEGWTPERLQALAKAQAKPKPTAPRATATEKQAAPSKIEPTVESKVESTTVEEPDVEADAQTETEEVVTAQSRFKKAATLIAQKTQAKAKEAANRAAQEAKEAAAKAAAKASAQAKDAAEKAKGAATKFAKNVGYESTAIPENAIVVHHRFLDREWSETWKQRFTWAVQFFFGGLFQGYPLDFCFINLNRVCAKIWVKTHSSFFTDYVLTFIYNFVKYFTNLWWEVIV